MRKLLSRLRKWLAKKAEPKQLTSRTTHSAYFESVCDELGNWVFRVYSYDLGKLVDEFSGTKANRTAALKHVASLAEKLAASYRR